MSPVVDIQFMEENEEFKNDTISWKKLEIKDMLEPAWISFPLRRNIKSVNVLS